VLMRRAGATPGPWYCSNVVNVKFNDAAWKAPDRAVLVPVPLVDRDLVKQALLPVDNDPIIGDSPRTKLSSRTLGPTRTIASASTGITHPAFVSFENAYRLKALRGASWSRVVALVYRQPGEPTAEAASFAVAACGALPKELAMPYMSAQPAGP